MKQLIVFIIIASISVFLMGKVAKRVPVKKDDKIKIVYNLFEIKPLSASDDNMFDNNALDWSLARNGIVTSYGDLSSPFDE